MRRWRRPIPWAGSAACPQWDAHPPSPLPFRESGSLQKPWHCLNITEFHKWKCWWNSGTGTRAPPCSAESVLFRSKTNPLPSGPNPSVFGPLLSLPQSRFSGPSRRRAHRKNAPSAWGKSGHGFPRRGSALHWDIQPRPPAAPICGRGTPRKRPAAGKLCKILD